MSRTSKINWHKWRNLSVLGLCALVMITQFQNCGGGAEEEVAADGSSPVHVIDQVSGFSALRFQYTKVQVTDQNPTAVLTGECERIASGTIVGWDVKDEAGAQGDGGTVQCDRGFFKVELATQEQFECGKVYEVSARLQDGTEGKTEVEMICSN